MKRLLRFIFLPVCLLITAISPSRAQYVSTGPNGGSVYNIYRDNSTTWLAGTTGIYQSNDDGRSWTEVAASPAIFGCDQLYSVAASGPQVYAGSLQSGIFRSNDGGVNWLASGTGLRLAPNSPFTDIEIAGGNVLALRADSGFLFLSSDNGVTWSRINLAIMNAQARFLSAHNNDVYVSTPQGLFKSMNNGLNFINVDPSPADFGKLTWVADTVYAATSTGIRMSLDGGATFTVVGLAGRDVRNVAVSGMNMYATVRGPAPLQDTVVYSNDGGASFSAAPFSPSFTFTFVNDVSVAGSNVIVGTNYGLYHSGNNGATWGLADSGYHATTVRGLAVSGTNVFAGTFPMGIFQVAPDSGALRWRHTGDLAHGVDGNISCIAAKRAFIHAGGTAGYYRSPDSGATWMAGATGMPSGTISSIYASPTTSDVLLIRNGNLYYSSDDGSSFGLVINSALPVNALIYVTRADTALFAATATTLYKAGATMVFSPASGLIGRVTKVIYTGGTFYASTLDNGLFSSPNGNAWTPVAVTLPAILPTRINTLALDGTTILAGTDQGIFSNASGTWMQDALNGKIVLSIALRNGHVFAGTCGGVYSVPYKIDPPPPPPPNGIAGIAAASGLDVWPNPASGDFSLRVAATAAGTGELVMRDITGSVVYRQSIALKAGLNELKVPAKSLAVAPGIYMVQVSGAALRATGRVAIR